ncbi:MAG: hypothetical protein H0V82_13265 [Candidatus Protochlamydia sp.]|nr:hypothetical protein [Candidatus Protochlamydia sp.]
MSNMSGERWQQADLPEVRAVVTEYELLKLLYRMWKKFYRLFTFRGSRTRSERGESFVERITTVAQTIGSNQGMFYILCDVLSSVFYTQISPL